MSFLEFLISLEQLFFGNKRLALYANVLMGIALSLHPITFFVAVYYIAQTPIEVLMDLIIYLIYPWMDTPPIDWQKSILVQLLFK